MAKRQIKNYVFKPGIGVLGNVYPNAYALLTQNKAFIQKEATAWIASQVSAGATGFVGYTYNTEKCERDVGLIIDGYAYDLRYGGNSKTHKYAGYYWDQDVAQIDGDRQPEIQTHTFIQTLVHDYIFNNTAFTALNVFETQVILSDNAEADATTKFETLSDFVISVITNGLSSLPTLEETGVGTVQMMGKYDTSELLLITNTTKNEIIYNFSNPSTGGTIDIFTDSSNFSSFLQTTDGVTQISLNYDTSSHSSTDDVQIFVEEKEVRTRPFDFGTDAIERMRIAPPLSMLDADFEYGLQPTKWAAIGTMRGYPSVYELPGTDTQVVSVVTDASVGTSGIGQSLITVTTGGPHGFSVNNPITIKALEDTVVGAARAEGSFIINSVPTDNTFTYFAKSKVGTTNGEVLATTYTQLREAAFYTGASIGTNPEFIIQSNGSAGTLRLELNVDQGATILPFDMEVGASPELGAPLVGTGIPTGAQVTQVIDQSAGGGTYLTPETVGDYNLGDTAIEVVDPAGIVPNLAVDSGDGSATYVTSVVGSTVNLSKGLTTGLIGNRATYTNVAGENKESTGAGAEFTITRSAGTYTVDAITVQGTGYEAGNKIVIAGNNLGGESPTNDLLIEIISIDVNTGGVTGTNVASGVANDGTGTFNDVPANNVGSQGTGARFDVTYVNNVYSSVTLNTTTTTSANYTANDIIQIDGSNLGGVTLTNDLIITVTTVDAGTGEITAFTVSGTAPDAVVSYDDPTYTTNNIGSGIFFTVTRTGTTYSWQFSVDSGSTGVDFAANDTITVLGSLLGGVDVTNDLTLTVLTVDGSGAILTFSVAGTAANTNSYPDSESTVKEGTGAQFNVSYATNAYTITLANGGTNYGANQELTISGTSVGAVSPTNDITITISSVDGSGAITAFTDSGTAPLDTETYTAISGTNYIPVGTLASFDITRTNGTYGTVSLATGGTGYLDGDIIVISGNLVGGQSPQNDISIKVQTSSQPTGQISSIVVNANPASTGVPFNLISTVLITEQASQLLLKDALITFSELATLDVTFDSNHGLVPGDTFIVAITSDDGTNTNKHKLAGGSFFVTEVPTLTSLRYQARTAGTIDTSGGDELNGIVYPRPDSFFVHRPYDGGVQLGTGGPQHGAQAIRQSKKYIRYQSGKGIMYTTGALFAPSYDLRSVTADGVEVNSTITVTTDDNDHGVQVGGRIRLIGIETPGYNSGPDTAVPPEFEYEVIDVVDERTFKVRSQRRLGDTNAVLGFGSQMSVVGWHGATVRSGIFDDQNGIFWEFDGTQISVVQRTGTRQLAGTVALQVDQNKMVGTNTRFQDQLKAGDRIVIGGMTHVVTNVSSQTAATVTPDWRGVVNTSGKKANLVVDKKVKQSDFNLDKLDGTGPSGYDIDVAKMQMIGIQYSWYGAGFIDFMLRGSDGNFVFCHRMRNSNVNTEAFMRSGNLPVRYEVTNEGPSGKLAVAMDTTQDTIILEDSSFFPTAGTVYIDNEIITFNGNDYATHTLTGCTRSATFTNFQAGADRSYTAGAADAHDARTGVVLISQTITPLISHWGSAFLTDGGFDEDRGYIFSYTEGAEASVEKVTSFLIRLAPTVSNALIGDLGERELLNRAQLLLQSLEITSDGVDGSNNPITGGIVIEGILNPKNYPVNPGDVQWQGLSTQAQGGQPSFAQVASGGAITWVSNQAGPTTQTVTVQSNMSLSGIQNSFEVRAQGRANNRDNFMYVYASNLDSLGLRVGSVCQTTPFNGATVTSISGPFDFGGPGGEEYLVDFDQVASNEGQTYSAGSLSLDFNFNTTRVNNPTVFYTEASWEASALLTGAAIDSTDTNFPAGTIVSSVVEKNFGTTNYYEVLHNNSSTGTLSGGNTVIYNATIPEYALPGETIFSFVATPGERATVDFSTLKELTNTPLGGRGTYPNGPDVLAINISKTKGAATDTSIILRWGEAQA